MKTRRSQQKTRREKRRFRKKIITLTLSIIAIVGTGAYIMNHSYLRLEGLRIEGQKTLIQSDIEEVVKEKLQTKILGIVPRDNIFIFRRSALEAYLKETFPKINDISVDIDNAEDIVITIGERTAHSLWCINKKYESVFDEECYFADNSGLLYARAPYFSGNVYLKLFILPYEDDQDYIGSSVRDSNSFESLFTFFDTLESQYPLRIDRIYFDTFDDVRIKIARLNNTTYSQKEVYIQYNQTDDYETIIRNIGITLDFKEFKKEFATQPERLSSIDVRFDGRIFFTFTPIDSESE